MMRYYSLGIKLNEVIESRKKEKTILENIRRCSKIVGKSFKVVFWHEGLSGKQCENFIKRNENLLFEVNTKITKNFERVWFLIGVDDYKKHGVSRYSYAHTGDILNGIVQYLEIIKHIQKREKDER